MTFLFPWGLLVLIPVAVLAVAYVVMLRRRQRYAVRFAALPLLDSVVPEQPRWRRHVPAALLVVALALTGLAVARPELPVRVPYERATIMVAIDTSASMRARDVEPDRLTAALDAAGEFIEQLPDTFNVGVVTFAGTTTVMHPPDTDHEAARGTLQMATTESRTAIGEGVLTSLDQIRGVVGPGQEDLPAHIVLLSDGSNTSGRPPALAAQVAAAAGVPVSTIAYGSESGTLNSGVYAIPVPVDAAVLADLSEATGGRSYEAASSDELQDVYEEIGSSIGWRTEQREVTPFVAGIALLVGLVAAAFSLRWFSRMI
ncbi:VWA domain-containing protein [Gordonia sp. HNM0687]|uniref:VWA domain-containing protein n=1 Tax=Gordonia mangrovi TaxID=2665643 RepID=A0A6L7GT84_9ACTN|nr:VWA domain-containing protein [Gordonia mangrovi]MDY6809026.1 VWA domain-containing protein [Actinomycetota bacterium]MXP21718.1 VWA domain-containing protein [Gordonia mangrovi]UVF80450.1 VWA domain-containing protein [Gordonia mangrovi]